MVVGDGAKVLQRLGIVALTEERPAAVELAPGDVLVGGLPRSLRRRLVRRQGGAKHHARGAGRQTSPDVLRHHSPPDPLKVTCAFSPGDTVTALRASSLLSGHFRVTV